MCSIKLQTSNQKWHWFCRLCSKCWFTNWSFCCKRWNYYNHSQWLSPYELAVNLQTWLWWEDLWWVESYCQVTCLRDLSKKFTSTSSQFDCKWCNPCLKSIWWYSNRLCTNQLLTPSETVRIINLQPIFICFRLPRSDSYNSWWDIDYNSFI